MLLDQLTRRFGALTDEQERRVRAASLEQLRQWSERFAEGASLEELIS